MPCLMIERDNIIIAIVILWHALKVWQYAAEISGWRAVEELKLLLCELQGGSAAPLEPVSVWGCPQQGWAQRGQAQGALRPCTWNGTSAKCRSNNPNIRNRKNCSRRTSLTSITQLGIWSSVLRDKQNNGEVFSVFLSNCIIVRLSYFESKTKIWTRPPTEREKQLRARPSMLAQTG